MAFRFRPVLLVVAGLHIYLFQSWKTVKKYQSISWVVLLFDRYVVFLTCTQRQSVKKPFPNSF
ncbi:MAG: hypothetical protein M9958_03505, partial [Chitinophagales bacterium]|nr:hypothetical protein [Chitinophagales bacterium]